MGLLSRRWLLAGAALAVLAIDLLLLAGAWFAQAQDVRPQQYVFVESTAFEPGDPQAMPWLNGTGWQLGDRRIDDLPGYARATAAKAGNLTPVGPILFAQLGPRPSFGQFLATTAALRAQGLCHVVIFSAGGPAPHYRLCGKCIGHVCP